MTISTTVAKSRYAGDGNTSVFPTGFKFLDTDHVRVILRRADGSESLWSEGSEYSLSGAGQPGGGSVQVSTGPVDHTPAVGETLVVKLAVPPRQETALPLGGAFPSTAVEGMADLAALRDQQIEEALSRAVKFKETTALADVAFPEPEAGKPIGWNAGGDDLVNLEAIGRWQGDWTTATDYVALDVVRAPVTKHIYVCEVAHAAGDFTTDTNAGKWSLAIDFDGAVADAEAARDKSQDWAEEAEDVEVEVGKFSALHHAAKAGASASAASQGADDADTARVAAQAAQLAAETAQTGAETAETNAEAAQAAAVTAQQTLAGINTQTGSAYTLQASDAGQIVEMDNAGANTVTIDNQANAGYSADMVVEVVWFGAGATTIAAANGVTLHSANGAVDLRAQYSGATLYRRGADEWVLVGDIA